MSEAWSQRPEDALRDQPARARTVLVNRVSGPLLRALTRALRAAVAEVVTACRAEPGVLRASLDRMLAEVERAPVSFVSERQRQRAEAAPFQGRAQACAVEAEGDLEPAIVREARRKMRRRAVNC